MEIVPEIHEVDGVNGNCYLIVMDGITLIDTGLPGSGRQSFPISRRRWGANPRTSG